MKIRNFFTNFLQYCRSLHSVIHGIVTAWQAEERFHPQWKYCASVCSCTCVMLDNGLVYRLNNCLVQRPVTTLTESWSTQWPPMLQHKQSMWRKSCAKYITKYTVHITVLRKSTDYIVRKISLTSSDCFITMFYLKNAIFVIRIYTLKSNQEWKYRIQYILKIISKTFLSCWKGENINFSNCESFHSNL